MDRHIVHRSIAVRRNVCFLDVSSLNLAALQSAATFFVRGAEPMIFRRSDRPIRAVIAGQFSKLGSAVKILWCGAIFSLQATGIILNLCIAATRFAALSASWTFPP